MKRTIYTEEHDAFRDTIRSFIAGDVVPDFPNWEKAGHAPIRAGSVQRAPDGRDWASDQALPNDSSLYLFPAWWPVGIWVELSTRAPAPGDTVEGRATALVARGNITPPVARVRAWRIPCGGAAAGRASASGADSGVQRARPHR